MTILIFANGDIQELAWIRPLLKKATITIAANGGSRHLIALGHLPDVIIGDLDSIPQPEHTQLKTAAVRRISHPPHKDETDLELALLHATQYTGDIAILGALGGRLDQILANMLLLAHPALVDRSVQLIEPYQRAWLVRDHTRIEGHTGDTISLIPLGEAAHIAHTTGLRWPLHDEVLAFGPARGVSNVMTADQATVTVTSGRLLCVHIHQEWGR